MERSVYDLSNVTVRYGERRVLDSVSASLGPEAVAVMGPSGSGKTTLLRVLAGQQRPNTGSVMLGGRALRFSKARLLDPRVAVIHQDYRLIEFLSVLDNVLLAIELRGSKKTESDARDLLERVGLGQVDLKRRPGTLSGGEQQRVAIARGLLCGAAVILADEPTGALDTAATVQIADLLMDLAESEGIQVVVATHDVAVAGRMEQCLLLSEGGLNPMSLARLGSPVGMSDGE